MQPSRQDDPSALFTISNFQYNTYTEFFFFNFVRNDKATSKLLSLQNKKKKIVSCYGVSMVFVHNQNCTVMPLKYLHSN